LDVNVDGTGAVQQVNVVRDVPPLTKAAKDGVSGWKFTPAMKGGQPVAGVARVNVVFNPFNPADVSIPNQPLPSPENPGAHGSGDFQLADVTKANYAVYPPNTVAFGTVVLDVAVGPDGSVAGLRVMQGRGLGPLTGAATRAIRSWSFVAAQYGGKAVESHTIVAYVFVRPEVGTQ